MRQVPPIKFTKYAVVGSGRVATHMHEYLNLLKIPFENFSRKLTAPNSFNEPDLKKRLALTLSKCSHVLILITDSKIDTFIKEHYDLLNKKVLVHFSGALKSQYAHCTHPLMTFTPKLYDLDDYKRTPFILERGGPKFETLLPQWPNKNFMITPEQRPLYHALCVASGNLTSVLLCNVLNQFEDKLNLPSSVLYPYLERIFINVITDKTTALTGPLQRNDISTIVSNLKALDKNNLKPIYESFLKLSQTNHQAQKCTEDLL